MMRYLLVRILLLLAQAAHAQSDVKWVRTNHSGAIVALSYTSDVKYLVSVGWREIILWDGHNGDFLSRQQLPASVGSVLAGTCLPNTHTLALTTDSDIVLYDIDAASIKKRILLPETNQIMMIRASVSGDTLLWITSDSQRPSIIVRYDQRSSSIIDSLSAEFYYSTRELQPQTLLVSKDLRFVVYEQSSAIYVVDFQKLTSVKLKPDAYRSIRSFSLSEKEVVFWNHSKSYRDQLDLETLTFSDSIASVNQSELDLQYFAMSPDSTSRAYVTSRGGWGINSPLSSSIFFSPSPAQTPVMITGYGGELVVSPIQAEAAAGGSSGRSTYDPRTGDVLHSEPAYHGGWGRFSYSHSGKLSYIAFGDYSSEWSHDLVAGDRSGRHHMAGQSNDLCFNTPQLDPLDEYVMLGNKRIDLRKQIQHPIFECPVADGAWLPSGSHYLRFSPMNSVITFIDRAGAEETFETGSAILRLAVASNGKHFATANNDQGIRIWNMDRGQVGWYYGHTKAITAIAFAPNGRQLVTASLDSTIRVWDIDRGEIYRYPRWIDPFNYVGVSHDGSTVVASTHNAVVGFDAVAWAEVKANNEINPSQLIASRIGNALAIQLPFSAESQYTVQIFDILGRLLHAEHAASKDSEVIVSLQNVNASPLLIRVVQGGATAHCIVL